MGQTLEWSKLFNIHSFTATAGIEPNSLKDNTGNIITQVVENNQLKLYGFDEEGNEILFLDTEMACGKFVSMIKDVNGNLVLLFDNSPTGVDRTYKLLKVNTDFEIADVFNLNFPFSTSDTKLSSIFEYNNQVYVSLFKTVDHYLFKIEANNSLTQVFMGNAGLGVMENRILLNGGKMLFDFGSGTQHTLRCVSLDTNQLVWEEAYSNPGIFPLQYKTISGNGDLIYLAGVERDWIGGVQQDVLQLKAINSLNGTVIQSLTVSPLNDCLISFNDLKFNPANGRLYLTYSNCFPNFSISLIELDTDFNITNQVNFDAEQDGLLIGGESHIHITNEGKLVFIYKSKKDEVEKGNLYIAVLDANLESNGALEINFTPKNSSETMTDIFSYDASKIVLTGIIPDPDPSIFWEEVQYFTLMIDIDNPLSFSSPDLHNNTFLIHPNPTGDILKIESTEPIVSITVYSVLGQQLINSTNLEKGEIDVSNLSKGLYVLIAMTTEGKSLGTKFIKN